MNPFNEIEYDLYEYMYTKLIKLDIVKYNPKGFKLKSGQISNIYIDFKKMSSFPNVIEDISRLIWNNIHQHKKYNTFICGVPYGGIPLAVSLSVRHKIPLLLLRKQQKGYGTNKLIEGHYNPNCDCILIEDVITTGSSVVEAIDILKHNRINVICVVCLVCRNPVQIKKLIKIFDYNRLIELVGTKKMDTYQDKVNKNSNNVLKKLVNIMTTKKTNLCLSVDKTKISDILFFADIIGPYICILKTHVDIIEDFSYDYILKLQELAEKHNFIIFEDRKFCDIGNTSRHQYTGGIYRISYWAEITNAHTISGPGIVDSLKTDDPNRALLLLAEMSSKGCLITPEYTKKTLQIAEQHPDFVIGFITQHCVSDKFMNLCPGVSLNKSSDKLDQQYNTPYKAIYENRNDIIIVGRGILNSKNPLDIAKEFQKQGWDAYVKRTLEKIVKLSGL